MIKNILALVGTLVVIGLLFAFIKFGDKISQVGKLDPEAIPTYMKMFDTVLETGDAAKGMVIKQKLKIEEGEDPKEAIEEAIEIMDAVGEEYGLAMVDTKLMSRGEKDDKGVYQPYIRIRSYCSPTIAKKFLAYSPEFIGFMPCRLGIVEDPKTHEVYIYTMSLDLMIAGGKTLPPELLKLANEVKEGMYSMLEKSASREED